MIKIIADSAADLTREMMDEGDVEKIPFHLFLGEDEYVDNNQLDVLSFIQDMVKSKDLPRTACPSPHHFMETFKEVKEGFVVAISKELSGTYNAAMLALEQFSEEHGERKIHVVNSKSAAAGENLVVRKLMELRDEGLDFEGMTEQIENFISNMKTYFISESLENLMKNGRISRFSGTMAAVLSIIPIMGADKEGKIVLFNKTRTKKKAYRKLVDMIVSEVEDPETKTLSISHVDNEERAFLLRDEVKARVSFKEIVIQQSNGLSSLYADNKGIVVAF